MGGLSRGRVCGRLEGWGSSVLQWVGWEWSVVWSKGVGGWGVVRVVLERCAHGLVLLVSCVAGVAAKFCGTHGLMLLSCRGRGVVAVG